MNLKNIADLPVAESVDNLNLIVNQNGSAKQIASSAVGAQADWTETNENSPAFIKNKPGYAQADWEETDENSASYVRNKPIYDTREYGNVTINFDGNIEGKEIIDFGEIGLTLVQFLDKNIPTLNDCIGGHITITTNEGNTEIDIVENAIMPISDTAFIIGELAIIVCHEPTNVEGLLFPAGVWAPFDTNDSIYVSEFTYRGVVNGEVKQFEQKYIPSDPSKMNAYSPSGTGSFSMNLPEEVTVGHYSFSTGFESVASGSAAHAEGHNTTASGQCSHAEGEDTTASGYESHAEGYNTTASGECSHAEGEDTTASGQWSHAEGYSTTASAKWSHAEGYSTTASGMSSHAEGSETTASGKNSHAEGFNVIASGNYSHAEGWCTTATNAY